MPNWNTSMRLRGSTNKFWGQDILDLCYFGILTGKLNTELHLERKCASTTFLEFRLPGIKLKYPVSVGRKKLKIFVIDNIFTLPLLVSVSPTLNTQWKEWTLIRWHKRGIKESAEGMGFYWPNLFPNMTMHIGTHNHFLQKTKNLT